MAIFLALLVEVAIVPLCNKKKDVPFGCSGRTALNGEQCGVPSKNRITRIKACAHCYATARKYVTIVFPCSAIPPTEETTGFPIAQF
jgi:hypothetical protein